MTAEMRRGACPALSAPMQTGDGLLVRLNLTEGGLQPATLAALCEAATRHGNGLVEITARGSLQVRGLTPASAPLFAEAVNALEVPVREGVPVETSPLAGLDPEEIADPSPLVRALRAAIEDAGLSRRLGPKVSVVIDGGGQVGLDAVAADVRVKAESGGRWLVSVDGAEPGVAGRADDTVAAVLSLLAGIAALGTAARGRDLPASTLPAIAGRRGNAGRIHLGTITLRSRLCALAVALPFGQCGAATLAALAADAPGITDFRFAPGRRLLALGSREACEALNIRAAALGFVTDTDDPRLSVAACAGAPACASGHFDAKRLGARAADMLPAGFAGTVHVSGCPKGCAHPAPAAFALVGTDAGVTLVQAGRAADAPVAVYPDGETALAALGAQLHKAAA